jgi:hypothetical protein
MKAVTDQLSKSLREAELDAPTIRSLCEFGYGELNY